MSTSFTPGRDLLLQARVPAVRPLFTTFATGHFVRPGEFTQPVKTLEKPGVKTPGKAEIQPATFAGGYTEIFTAVPIDLDYDEPNAVVEADLEIVSPTSAVHQMELPVSGCQSTHPAVSPRVKRSSSRRSAA